MVASKNYKVIETIMNMANVLYNDVVSRHPENFRLDPKIKTSFMKVKTRIFLDKLETKLTCLDLKVDARNLNLPFTEFYAENDVLKHKVLTYPRQPISAELYSEISDNSELITLREDLGYLVRYVRGTVNPLIKSIINDVTNKIKATELNVVKDGWNIQYVEIPEYAQSLYDEGQLTIDAKYNQPFDIDLSAGKLENYLPATGETEMLLYLEKFSPNKIKKVYETYLSRPNSSDPLWIDLMNLNRYDQFDDLFIVYILASHMLDQRINQTLGLVEHNGVIMTILNLVTNKMLSRLEAVKNAYLQSRPILTTSGKDAYLIKPILNKGIQEGISMDTIYGALHAEKVTYSTNDLLVNDSILSNNWKAYITQQKLINAKVYENNNLQSLILTLRAQLIETLVEIDEVRLDEILRKVDTSDLRNLEQNITTITLLVIDNKMLFLLYKSIEEYKSTQLNSDAGIEYYVGLALYTIISTILIDKITR